MIQSCSFSITDETKSMVIVTWKINTNEFAAKAEFFSNQGKEPHIYANSAEDWRGIFREVCQATSQSQ